MCSTKTILKLPFYARALTDTDRGEAPSASTDLAGGCGCEYRREDSTRVQEGHDILLGKGVSLGSGWFGVESDGNRLFRWCTGLASIRIDARVGDHIVLYGGTDRPGRKMLVYADGRNIASFTLHMGWYYYCLALPACATVHLGSEFFVPGNGDRRQLALMVSELFQVCLDGIGMSVSPWLWPNAKPLLPTADVDSVASQAHNASTNLGNGRGTVEIDRGNQGSMAVPPPVLQQTAYRVGFFDLDYREDTVFFNGAVFNDGAPGLVVRRADVVDYSESGGYPILDNSLAFFRLDDEGSVIGELDVSIEAEREEQFEDPRVLSYDGRFLVSCCNYMPNQQHLHQKILVLDSRFSHVDSIDPVYGGNGEDILANTATEKNWTWFSHDGRLHCEYRMIPHEVVEFDEGGVALCSYRTYEVEPSSWRFGECRMGSNPVLVDGLYYGFFHSSLPWKGGRRRYFMGAYAFEPIPPFPIVQMSRAPILVGSEQDVNNLGSPPVVFPCGAIIQNDEWLISFGVNDERCGWIRMSHPALIKELRLVSAKRFK